MKNNIGINDWGLTYNTSYRIAESKQRINEKESFAVKLCPKCNYVYEMTLNQYKNIFQTSYYENFPRRGLYNQVCFKCK